MKLLHVLIEHRLSSIDAPFTYICDDTLDIKVGCRVYVPFKNQSVVAYVIKVENTFLTLEQLNKKDNINYRYIHKVLDEKPILNDELFALANKLSKDYVTPLISCLQTILPPTYKPSSSALKEITYKKLKKVVCIDNVDLSKLTNKQLSLYNQIKKNDGLFIKDLPVSPIKTLLKNGYLNEVVVEVKEDYFKDYVKEFSSVSLNEEQQ